jgi:hypothetical protein
MRMEPDDDDDDAFLVILSSFITGAFGAKCDFETFPGLSSLLLWGR